MNYKETTKSTSWVSNYLEKFIDLDKNTGLYKDEIDNVDLENVEKQNKLEQFIQTRKSDMISAKSWFQNDIKMADLAYEAKSDIVINWTPFFNYPLEKSICGILDAELWDRDIVYKIEATGSVSDINKIKPNQIVMDRLYTKDGTSKKMKMFRKHFLKYGFSVVFEWINVEKRKLRSNNDKFDWVFLKWETDINKDVYTMWLNSRVVHPSNFYIDNAVIDYEEANDCIEIELLGKYDVLSKFTGKQYFNKSRMVESLLDKDNQVSHYYNIMEDIYAVMINDVLIYSGASPYPHSDLPYSIAVMSESDSSAYGEYWISKLLRFAKPYLNEIFNITIKQSKNANQPPIMLGNWWTFDGQEPTYWVGNVWKFSGSLTEVRQLDIKSPDTTMFNIITILQDLIVQLIGVDPRSIYSAPNITKFAAWLNEQAKNKRVAVFGKSLDYAYANFLNQRLKNAHFFLSIIEVEEIVDPNSIKKAWYNKILLKDTQINKLWDWSLEFDNAPWAYAEFEMRPEYLKWTFNVEVITESTKPILKEIAKEDISKANNEVLAILNTMNTMNPEIAKTIDFKQMIKAVYDGYGIDPENMVIDTQSNRIADKIKALKEKAIEAANQVDVNPQDQMMNWIVNGQDTQIQPNQSWQPTPQATQVA